VSDEIRHLPEKISKQKFEEVTAFSLLFIAQCELAIL
jgi:hypothetical protein